jgi:ABC-2 type transport system ATP-binding protein
MQTSLEGGIRMIKTQNLGKKYGELEAVKGLNLDIRKGMSFGLVGPNGAGKTTTIRMLAGLLPPSDGTIEINGVDLTRSPRRIYSNMGYMPDEFGLYTDLKVWEYLDYFGRCYGLGIADRKSRIDDLLHMVRLGHKMQGYVSSLSRGMRQRLLVAKTLIHDPDILLLDEPTSGLDPRSRIELLEILKELSNSGRTMIVASNILYDLSSFCNSLGIIDNGTLIESGPLSELTEKYKKEHKVHIHVIDGLDRIEDILGTDKKIVSISVEGKYITLRYEGTPANLAELNARINEAGIRITGLCEEKETLEDIFLRIAERE